MERLPARPAPYSTHNVALGHSFRIYLVTFFQSITHRRRRNDRRASHIAALAAGLLHRDVFRVQMHEALHHALQPLVRIVSAQEGVAGVEVDPDAGLLTSF